MIGDAPLRKEDSPLNTASPNNQILPPLTGIWFMLCPALGITLCALSLPPFDWWPLALIQWMPLLWWSARTTPRMAGAGGALTGFALGLYLYFGAAVLDVPTFLLASSGLGLAFAVFCAAVPAMFRNAGPFAPYALGALWAALELGLAAARLPFSTALTLTSAPLLLQAAAIGGVTLIAAVLVAMQCAWVRCAMPNAGLAHWRIALSTLVLALMLTALGNAHRPPVSGTMVAAAAQTDLHPFWYVHAEADGHLARLQHEQNRLYAMTNGLGADLLIWPEVPFARFDLRNPARTQRSVGSEAVARSAELIAGNDLSVHGEQFNAVVAIDQSGTVRSRHTKSVLLPRLEREYHSGISPQPHSDLPGRPGALICFESAFPAPARTLSQNGAGLLTIATSDAYAGPSVLASLHASFAILRAIENRRAVVRAANGGPSLIVSERGTVLARGALFQSEVLSAQVNVIPGPSLYARHATLFQLAAIVLGVGPLLLTVYAAQRSGGEVSPPAGNGLAGGVTLVVITGGLIALQIHHHATLFAQAHSRTTRPSLGFVDTIATKLSYATLGSTTREGDLSASVAALLRRFGIDQTAAGVETQRRRLEAASVFQIGARALVEHYGLATTPWNETLDRSTIPCVAQLNDQSVVLITRVAGTAIEVFSPAEAAYSSVPRPWLSQALHGSPTCVIGRTFAWDLGP